MDFEQDVAETSISMRNSMKLPTVQIKTVNSFENTFTPQTQS
jgi:hypothetical protein